ncbi:AEC family transporter [uncultured Sphaerochaeta sp.]|uniref:AEC family transporter n=1 Tax=uncultured Sphaerochaeta sp. TaxID=886478 RepID=UPI002A0A204F|nr:AEC family transporter [uncultured Sphaerochaeta sp.]
MEQSFAQPLSFLFIIFLANLLKRIGLFGKDDFKVLAKITINVTLPSAIIASFDSFSMDYSLLVLVLVGILSNSILMAVSYWIMRKESNYKKSYALLNGATYNIGNFSFPFIQGLFGASGMVVAALFDLGNALMATGFTYSLAASVAGNIRPNPKDLVKKLFESVPFDTYLVMLLLSFLNIHLPSTMAQTMQLIGKANPIVAMFMIGLMLDLHFEKDWIKDSVKMLLVRYLGAIAFSLAVWYFTPWTQVVKITLTLLFFSPISTISSAFTERCTHDGRLSSFTTSLSVIAGILLYMILIPILTA